MTGQREPEPHPEVDPTDLPDDTPEPELDDDTIEVPMD